jgi:hypothetical protein
MPGFATSALLRRAASSPALKTTHPARRGDRLLREISCLGGSPLRHQPLGVKDDTSHRGLPAVVAAEPEMPMAHAAGDQGLNPCLHPAQARWRARSERPGWGHIEASSAGSPAEWLGDYPCWPAAGQGRLPVWGRVQERSAWVHSARPGSDPPRVVAVAPGPRHLAEPVPGVPSALVRGPVA